MLSSKRPCVWSFALATCAVSQVKLWISKHVIIVGACVDDATHAVLVPRIDIRQVVPVIVAAVLLRLVHLLVLLLVFGD